MNSKYLNIALILTSFMGYLEWGGGNSMFLWQGEIDIIEKLFTNPGSAVHPFTVLPLCGQLLLLVTLFQRTPNKWLTYAGMGGVGVLLVFMFIIGLISLNARVTLSTLPFIVTAVLVLRHHRASPAVGGE